MPDRLIHMDQQALLAVNGWHAPWADTLMWFVSAWWTWLPLYLLMLAAVVWRYRLDIRQLLCLILAFALAVGLADWVSSGLIKPWVGRLRPTHEPALAGLVHTVRGYTGGLYGFVSSHAADTMAAALLFALLWRNKYATGGLMLWVALNCYSRMYLGVHYPGDILGGLMVGALSATAAYAVLRRWGPTPHAAEPSDGPTGGHGDS